MVGDACTDDSEEVVRSFADPRVRWENLEENSGSQSGPNNRGLALARGELIAYQGHDDVWHPYHLATLVHAMATPMRTWPGQWPRSRPSRHADPRPKRRALESPTRARLVDPAVHDHAPPRPRRRDRRVAGLARRGPVRRRGAPRPGPPSGGAAARDPGPDRVQVPVGHRPNSYREKPSHEQAEYTAANRVPPGARLREIGAALRRRLSPLPERPLAVIPKAGLTGEGDRARLMRQIRGLD